jgi:hypothetical protein
VEAQKDKAAEKIGSVAGALRAAGEPLAEIGPLPDLAGRAADQIESIAEYVQSRTVGDIAREVERFARREPAIFLGAAFGIGLLAGRFLKSSPRRTDMMLTDHPEIQDEMFEEELSFGTSNLARSGLDRSGVGRFETSRRETGWTSSAGSNTWGERSVERDNPGVDRTMNSGFGGFGGSYATGTSSAYDTTGSSVSAKPASDLASSSFREGAITKPMGTLGDSSVTAATPSTSSSAGSSSSIGATATKPISDSPLTTPTTSADKASATAKAGNGTSASSNGTTRSTNR